MSKTYHITTAETSITTPYKVGERRLIDQKCEGEDDMQVSDGYHTMDELYAHRIELWIALCRTLAEASFGAYGGFKRPIWRARQHADGSSFDGWFVLGIGEKAGEQLTYHLSNEKWDDTDFAIVYDRAPEWDGHTAADVLERIKTL